jgi:hypothetical protein
MSVVGHVSAWPCTDRTVTGVFGSVRGQGVRLNPTRTEVDVHVDAGTGTGAGSQCKLLQWLVFDGDSPLEDAQLRVVLPGWCTSKAVAVLSLAIDAVKWAAPDRPTVREACGDWGPEDGDGDDREGKGAAKKVFANAWTTPEHLHACHGVFAMGTLPARVAIRVTICFKGTFVTVDRGTECGGSGSGGGGDGDGDGDGRLYRDDCAPWTVHVPTLTGPGRCTRTLGPDGRPCPGHCSLAGGYWRRELGRGCPERDHVARGGILAGVGVRVHIDGRLAQHPLDVTSPTHGDDVALTRSADGGLCVCLAARDGTVCAGTAVFTVRPRHAGEATALARMGGASGSGAHQHHHPGMPPRPRVLQARVQFTIEARVRGGGGGGGAGPPARFQTGMLL